MDFCSNCAPDCRVTSLNFQKISGEGLTEPPPQTPPSLYLGLRPKFSSDPRLGSGFAPICPSEILTWLRLCSQLSRRRLQGRRQGWKDGRVQVVVNQYFATKFWAGPMLQSQKLGGPDPCNPCGGCASGRLAANFPCSFITRLLRYWFKYVIILI